MPESAIFCFVFSVSSEAVENFFAWSAEDEESKIEMSMSPNADAVGASADIFQSPDFPGSSFQTYVADVLLV